MKEIVIAQDNRLTTSRYELTLSKRGSFITSSKKLANIIQGNDLFDDLILNIAFLICKEVNQKDNKKKPGKHWRNSSPQLHLCK
jgi:hypothetical protein